MGCRVTALVSDVHTAERAYTPYQRPPDAQALRTAIPRGLVSFVVRGAVLAAKPVNDTELLSVSLTLPGGFGYLLNEIHVNLVQDDMADWESEGHWRLSQSSFANQNFDYRFPIQMRKFSQNGTTIGVGATRINSGTLTRTPIVPRSIGATQSLSFANLQAAVQGAGTVDAVISFWEYDLEQIAYFPIHSAANTLPR